MNYCAGLLLSLQAKRKTRSITQPCPQTAIKRSPTTMKCSSHLMACSLVAIACLIMATAGADDQLLSSTTSQETPAKRGRDLQQQQHPSYYYYYYYSRQQEMQKGLHHIPPDLFIGPDKNAVVTRVEPKPKVSTVDGNEHEPHEEDASFERHVGEHGQTSEEAKNTTKKKVRSSSLPDILPKENVDNKQHVFQQQGENDISSMQVTKSQRKPAVSNAAKEQSAPIPEEEQKLLLQHGQKNILNEEKASDNEQNAFEQHGKNDAKTVEQIKPRRKPNNGSTNREQADTNSEEQTLLLQHEEFNLLPHLSEQESSQEETLEEKYNFFAQGAHDEELKNKTRGKSTTSAHLPTRMYNMATKDAIDDFNEQKGTDSRVLVHYTNQEGRKFVLQAASKIHHDFADENILAVDMESSDAIEELRQSAWIDRVEEDSLWIAQGYLERIVQEEELRDGRYWQDQNSPHENSRSRNVRRRHRSERKLVEQVPYGITMIQADQVQVGPNLVQVCIVDTGIGLGHPDIDPARADGIDRESDVDGQILHWNEDVRGHGTHVSGIMAAKSNNDLGVRGVGDVHVFVTRGLDNEGRAYESDIREAMEQCEAAEAKIINLSLGGSKMSSAMKSICDRLYKKGFLIFAAAGNSGEWRLEYPASDPTVVSVSAVDSLEWYWANANYGPTQELMAPGVSIISTTWSEEYGFTYAEYSGTSMATPHASAAAAVLWSHRPECTNQQIRYALAYTAKDKGSEGCDSDFGYGIIQIKDALEFLNKYPCVDANWGRNHGSGNCTTIDEEPDPSLTFPPSDSPSSNPTENPAAGPTPSRTTSHPVASPTLSPTDLSTADPTDQPTKGPINMPTLSPTHSEDPTNAPSTFTEDEVVTKAPDHVAITLSPTMTPSVSHEEPTTKPPTPNPTSKPTSPKDSPTSSPIPESTTSPTQLPTFRPTRAPLNQPTPRPTKSPTPDPIPTPMVTTRQPTVPPTAPPITAPPVTRPTLPPVTHTTPSDPQTSSPTIDIDLGEAEVITPFPTETPVSPSSPPPPPPSPTAPTLPATTTTTTTTTTQTTPNGGREWFRTSSGEMTTANSWQNGGRGGGRGGSSKNRHGGNPNDRNPGIFTSGSKSRKSGPPPAAAAAAAAGNDKGSPNNNNNNNNNNNSDDSTPRNWFRSSSFHGVFNIYGRNNDSDDDGRRRRRWNGD